MQLDIDARRHHLGCMTDSKPEPAGNQGAQLLALAIKARGVSINEAGRMVKAPSGYMSRLLSNERKPNRQLSLALQEIFGVAPGAWDQALPDADEDADIPPVSLPARAG